MGSHIEERDGYLFSPSLLEPHPDPTLVVRPLHIGDFRKGFCELLAQLTVVGENMNEAIFQRTFQEWRSMPGVYFVVVIEDTNTEKIIGTATVFLERKLVHSGGKVGHVEDVVVNSTYRGKNLGKTLITQLQHLAKHHGCYKIILDCAEKNVSFYEKCGFERHEVQMAHYFAVSPKL